MAVLISSIFWACQHNEIEPTPLDPLAKAKDWTKTHLPPKALSKTQKSGSSTSLEYAFDWEESHLTQFNGKNLLDIPFSYLHNQQIVHTQMVSEAVLNADLLSANTVHRLLLLEKATHQYEAVVMQIMAEEEYLAQHNLDEVAENVRFNAIPADFSGQVIFLDPQTGRQIQGGRYQNGQLTAKISQEKITCETIITYIYEGTEVWIGGVLMRYDEAELVEVREETICWDGTPPSGGGDGGYYGGGGGGSGSTSPPAEEEFCPFEECEEEIIVSIENQLEDPCLSSVLELLISNSLSNDLIQAIQGIFNSNDDVNLIIVEDSTISTIALSEITQINNTYGLFRIEISLNPNLLTNTAQEYIAETILHEFVHAYMDASNIMLDDSQLNQHLEMLYEYVNWEKEALQESFPNLSNYDAFGLILGGFGIVQENLPSIFSNLASAYGHTPETAYLVNHSYINLDKGTPCSD